MLAKISEELYLALGTVKALEIHEKGCCFYIKAGCSDGEYYFSEAFHTREWCTSVLNEAVVRLNEGEFGVS
jgi:hypothetical protein